MPEGRTPGGAAALSEFSRSSSSPSPPPPAAPPVFPPPPVTPQPPPEPTALKEGMLRRAHASPAEARVAMASGDWLGRWLWDAWHGPLSDAGGNRSLLYDEVARSSRELWLWVMGERRWAEVAALLYGGVRRRAGAGRVAASR